MANTTNTFLITGLDFDQIKLNLKTYLQKQTVFSDYNFEGSALSILLDLLSVNTHYLGYYLSMVSNEMFLDSASQRSSLVSLAKQLNYTPRSRKASTALVNLVLIPNNSVPPPNVTIPKFFPFSTAIDGTSYTFITDSAYNVKLDIASNTYSLNNVVLKEGIGYSYQYGVDPSQAYQKFVVPNPDIDITDLTVRVQASTTNTAVQVFNLADNVDLLTGTSKVYFLQEGDDMQYEIYFGDGVLGAALDANNVVIVDYIVCNADAPNLAASFVAGQQITGIGNIQVTTLTPAFGGSERESMDSIRFSAPKSYEAQNRAVTVQDYKTLLVQKYPNVQSLSVWGGEDNDPPIYGKVFVSMQPVDGFVVTQTVKNTIVHEILSAINVVTVIPEIINPDYLFLEVNSLVKYNSLLTTLPEDQLKFMVLSTIESFNTQYIDTFEAIFRYSFFTRLIDLTDSSITNNWTTIRLQKRFDPILQTFQNVTLNFTNQNPIQPGTLSSTKFVVKGDPTYIRPYQTGDTFQFDDDAQGNLRVFKQVGSEKVIVNATAGTVDYLNGIVNIINFVPDSIVDNTSIIKVSALPVTNDVVPLRNSIIVIDPLDVTVNMQIVPQVIA